MGGGARGASGQRAARRVDVAPYDSSISLAPAPGTRASVLRPRERGVLLLAAVVLLLERQHVERVAHDERRRHVLPRHVVERRRVPKREEQPVAVGAVGAPAPRRFASDGGFVITQSSAKVWICSSASEPTRRMWPRRPSGTSCPVALCSRQPCTSNSLVIDGSPPQMETVGGSAAATSSTPARCGRRGGSGGRRGPSRPRG